MDSKLQDRIRDETAKVASALQILHAMAEAIRVAGCIPSGHLYAHVMSRLSIETYESAIGLLVRSGLVRKEHDLLTWVGEQEEVKP